MVSHAFTSAIHMPLPLLRDLTPTQLLALIASFVCTPPDVMGPILTRPVARAMGYQRHLPSLLSSPPYFSWSQILCLYSDTPSPCCERWNAYSVHQRTPRQIRGRSTHFTRRAQLRRSTGLARYLRARLAEWEGLYAA
jgi:hypothetical protein